MSGKDLSKLVAAGLVGATLAFPAGLLVARLGADAQPAVSEPHGRAGPVRDVFSPSFRSDPWFLDRQREGVEALEAHCRRSGELCAEAREARRWLDARGG